MQHYLELFRLTNSFGIDKLYHLILSIVLTLLLCYQVGRRNAFIATTTIGLIKELMDEHVWYLQLGSHGDVDDLTANVIGAFVGIGIYALIRKVVNWFEER